MEVVNRIYEEIQNRRDALIRALTEESQVFLLRADEQNLLLCLVGLANRQWRVIETPRLRVPLPENYPLPIGFPFPPTIVVRGTEGELNDTNRLILIASAVDGWLVGVALYYVSARSLSPAERTQLLGLVHGLPLVLNVVQQYHNPGPNPGQNLCVSCHSHTIVNEPWTRCIKCHKLFHEACVFGALGNQHFICPKHPQQQVDNTQAGGSGCAPEAHVQAAGGAAEAVVQAAVDSVQRRGRRGRVRTVVQPQELRRSLRRRIS